MSEWRPGLITMGHRNDKNEGQDGQAIGEQMNTREIEIQAQPNMSVSGTERHGDAMFYLLGFFALL